MTFIECTIVLIVLGLIIGIAVPGYQWLIYQEQFKRAFQETYSTVRYARMQAITRHQRVRIRLNDNVYPELTVALFPSGKALKHVRLTRAVALQWKAFPAVRYLQFDGIGEAKQNGSFLFKNRKTHQLYKKKIVVSMSGRVRVSNKLKT